MLSANRAAATGRRLLRGSLAQTGDDTDSHDDFKPKVRAEKATQTVQDHIEQDIKENPVMVYMKGVPDAPQCGFSAMVVRILKEYDVSYNSRNVLADPELREGIKQFSHWPTIPQVFVNGEFVGGSDILITMHRSGELEKLLEQTKHKQSSKGVETGSSYEEAVAVIDTLIHRGPASDSVASGKINWAGHFEQTFKHLKILELEEPLERLSIIHVAGTKGKGSTCAFAESMLRAAGFRTGLFTSPHLLDICERFRFDGLEVSRDVFAEQFWWCYNRLQANTNIAPMPGFFRFTTLLALRMFIIEKVDVAILEVGLGGRLDATNVVRAPAVCGIASLGYDHMDLLGNTLREIANEKAGIFKAGVPVVTAPQPEEAMEALQMRAQELKIPLTVASPVESYGLPNLKLGLRGEHQRINAALAIALCRHWAKRSGNEEHWSKALQAGGLPESYILGLASTHWPGRAEIIHDQFVSEDEKSIGHRRHPQSSRLQFYLDGAHSPESMEACAKWFCDTVKAESITSCVAESDYGGNGTISLGHKNEEVGINTSFRRVLLFNCMPKRDPTSLLPPLVNLCTQQDLPFHMAFFAPPASSLTSLSSLRSKAGNAVNQPDLSWQLTIQKCWDSLQPTTTQESNGRTFQVASNDTSGQEFYAGLEEQKEVCHRLNSSSAVMSSLPGTLEWIRSCARRHPQLQIQVLVTGSLYLVGDMLKLLKH